MSVQSSVISSTTLTPTLGQTESAVYQNNHNLDISTTRITLECRTCGRRFILYFKFYRHYSKSHHGSEVDEENRDNYINYIIE